MISEPDFLLVAMGCGLGRSMASGTEETMPSRGGLIQYPSDFCKNEDGNRG
jgi:hypothetical protein